MILNVLVVSILSMIYPQVSISSEVEDDSLGIKERKECRVCCLGRGNDRSSFFSGGSFATTCELAADNGGKGWALGFRRVFLLLVCWLLFPSTDYMEAC